MKKVWLLAMLVALAVTITTISCFGGGGSSGDDDDDDNDTGEVGACCNLENECSATSLTECNDDGGRWLGAQVLCVPDPCSGDDDDDNDDNDDDDIFDDDDDDDDDTFPDDDDDDDDDDNCNGNTAPTFDMVIWVVGSSQVEYPSGVATATIADTVGVGFSFEDAECNLIGGYGTVSITVDGETQTDELGPYTDDIGCSTDQSQRVIGFFYDGPLPAGYYQWTFSATDICDATSQEQSGAFRITE